MAKESILFSPFTIGSLTLRNRIIMAPLYLGYANPDGTASPLLLDHYEAMADSGISLLVVENAAVDERGLGSPLMLRVDDDVYLRGLTSLARTIKQRGPFVFLQLNHAGRYAYMDTRIAPSAVPLGKIVPQEMREKDIAATVVAFAEGAARAKAAGFDGVELHGGTGYLLSQFLSPRLNRRVDGYGGSPERRMRFPLEVVAAVKDRVGPDYPVGYRFLADELYPGGLKLEESLPFAGELKKAGVAYISVMAGVHESFKVTPYKEMEKEEGYMVPFAAAVRKAVPGMAVIAAGRLQTPAFSESVLLEGKTDLIGLARVLFADPRWPKKAEGLIDEPIIPCEVVCDLCTRMVMLGRAAYCSQWPEETRKAFPGRINEKENT